LSLKIDLHVHSCYSNDSLITLKELIFYAQKRGLDGVAITDHNRLDSALKIAQKTNFLIIPGVEISSLGGHIIGLNVHENIPPNQCVDETVQNIHEAGGIAIACHPVSFFKRLDISRTTKFDAVEVINSSAIPFQYSIKKSRELAHRLNLPHVAGSDAHYGPEIGLAYTLINSHAEVIDIIHAIRKGLCTPIGVVNPLKYRLKRKILRLQRRLSLINSPNE